MRTEYQKLWRLERKKDPLYREKLRVQGLRWRRANRESWSEYFSKHTKCEICQKRIFFNNFDRRTSINFDHRQECVIKTAPSVWLNSHKFNEENRKIWESCNFGILCMDCNILLPTVGRIEWLNKITEYIIK